MYCWRVQYIEFKYHQRSLSCVDLCVTFIKQEFILRQRHLVTEQKRKVWGGNMLNPLAGTVNTLS